MDKAKKMDYSDKNDVIKSLLKKYLTIDGNILKSERLFIAKSGINWIYQNTKNPTSIKHYIKEIESYLKGEINLSWKNGLLFKKVDKNAQ